MLSINFGDGTYHSQSKDIIKEIPSSGNLPIINFPQFKYEKGIIYTDCIVVALPEEKFDSPVDIYDEIRIYWVEERQELVAFRCNEVADATRYPDMYVYGPYALNEDMLLIIAQTFNINPSTMTLEQIAKSSPTELEGFSQHIDKELLRIVDITWELESGQGLNLALMISRQAGTLLMNGFGRVIPVSSSNDRSKISTDFDEKSLRMILRYLLKYRPSDGIVAEDLEGIATEFGLQLNTDGIFPGESGLIWAIDPLCGTIPFARGGIADFCTSIALLDKQHLRWLLGVVYDPAREKMFYALNQKGAFLNGKLIKVSAIATPEELKKGGGMVSIEHKMFRDGKYLVGAHEVSKAISRQRTAGTCGLEMAGVAAGWLDAVLKAKQPLYDYAAGKILVEEAGGIVTGFKGEPLTVELSSRKCADILAANPEVHKLIIPIFNQKP